MKVVVLVCALCEHGGQTRDASQARAPPAPSCKEMICAARGCLTKVVAVRQGGSETE